MPVRPLPSPRSLRPAPILALALAVWAGPACGGSAPTRFGLLADAGGGTTGNGADATTGSNSCVPGQQSACACPGLSIEGAQTCNADGRSFGPCTGCGGNVDGTAPQGADAGSPAEDGAPADGSSTDTGDTGPGNPACDVPTGGLPCDPGNVTCSGAGSSCAISTSYCCENLAGSTGTCSQSGSSCSQSDSLECDETADCNGGVCCMAISVGLLGTTVTATCKPSCSNGEFELCRSNTECPSGKCTPQSCISGGNTEACTTVTGCTAK
jgi:hypothetical protein